MCRQDVDIFQLVAVIVRAGAAALGRLTSGVVAMERGRTLRGRAGNISSPAHPARRIGANCPVGGMSYETSYSNY